MTPAKGLLCHVYRCGLGAAGSHLVRFNKVVLIDESIEGGSFEPDPERWPACHLARAHEIVVPDQGPAGKPIGPMFGGSFVYSSDSRFPSRNPIPLHDRWETQRDYDVLCS